MKKTLLMGVLMATLAFPALAAEKKDTRYGDIQPDPVTTSDRAVWGAIAYSPSTGRNGIFYGAPSREEARDTAIRYYRHAAGQRDNARTDCSLAVIMYNDWDDRRFGRVSSEANRAPHCGALAASDRGYAAERGPTLKEARDAALAVCSTKGSNCKLVQDLCT
ncbi:hypothetical protein GCM10007874_19540 [Labrys miyagiensis]|uniref:DUF4189 domain-containing protein n=1 Tax=Labrys miyagiensis TaxID=346912 RepID=A0ABQ6CH31_9HYPH|nr:DUF4189 domain-containing protein [Labrys miyagiensis]GLS18937.1 hypothetical protein GCM10007874_19540 [Labrys miyagiensis]